MTNRATHAVNTDPATTPGSTPDHTSGQAVKNERPKNCSEAGEEAMRRYLRHLGLEPTTGVELMQRVRIAAQLYDAITAAKMRAGKLSPPRMRLLLCLFGHEVEGETWLSPTRLSQELGLSKNTVSAHLRALEEMGFVVREVDPDDLRQFQICLAAAGRDYIRQSAPEHLCLLDGLAQALPPREIQQLLSLLGKLIASLELHGAKSE